MGTTKKALTKKRQNAIIKKRKAVVFIKVLITTDLFTTKTNGVVTSTHNLISELKKRGHDVRVITFSKSKKSYTENGVYYIKSLSLEWIYPEVRMPSSRAGKFIKEIVEWKPDVIHSQCEFFSYGFAKRVSKKTGAPIVHTYHTLYDDYVGYAMPCKRIGKWLVRRYLSVKRIKRVDTIIAPTEKVKKYLTDTCKSNKKIVVIPSGINLEKHKISFTNEDREKGRAQYGFDSTHFVLTNLGRLGTEKNLEEIVSFFAKISKKYAHARLLIVGGGPALEELKKLANELDVADKTVFAGMVVPDEVAKYYRLGDLFVCASISETQGLTYIEAAANGLPLLCRNDPCIDEVVKDGENGFRYNDFSEYEKHLDFIINNPTWQENAGKISKEISEKFDVSVFGETVETLYKNIT
jgi:1,2-diacylglycerol 3-alpha-glucosyltransferase